MSTASPEPLPGGEGAEEGLNSELRQLSDQVLQGKLERMEDGVGRGIAARLPDGGKTYGLFLRAVRRELARRQAAACSPPPPMETPACPSKQLPDVHVVQPKLEPCEDSPVPAPAAAEDCETSPLSGDHPFFTTVMSRSQVQKPFQLCIPGRFQRRLPAARTAAVLLCRGKSWAMCYCGDLKVKKLDAEWMSFAVDNRLRVGDACVFELVTGAGGEKEEVVVFQVQILRGGLPEEVITKGATADDPLVIVD